MRQYLLSVIHGEDDAIPAGTDVADVYAAVEAFNARLEEASALVFGGGLLPPASATVVDAVGGGEPVVTDGPYLESREQLGGFWVIRAEDLDAALAWTQEASAACYHAVELRPFQDEG